MSVQTTLEGWVPSVDWATYYPAYEVFKEFFPLLLSVALVVYGFVIAKRKFQKHTYYDVVTYSLNTLRKPRHGNGNPFLMFRTQKECHLEDLLPRDKNLLKAIEKAAKKCNWGNMFMHVNGSPRTQELFLNALSSHWIAEQSADGDLAREMDLAVTERDFWIGVTFEPYERPPIRKIRVMIISEEDLRRTFSIGNFFFENPSHEDRIITLNVMKDLYNDPELRNKYLIRRTITKRI